MIESEDRPLHESAAPKDLVFRNLMGFRIRDILLVSSPYDSYVLQEDGFLSECLDVEYQQLNLSAAPWITQASTGTEGLEALSARPFDLVITMPRLGEMDVHEFGREVKRRHPGLPVILLADSPSEAVRAKEGSKESQIDQVFVWGGDVRLFLAIIKHVEDQRNAERDMALAGVRAILLIEDSVRFYSSYLPMLYTELVTQNQLLMADGVNATQRLRRMRARPKILLAESFEEAWNLFSRHQEFVLGVIADGRFPRDGVIDPDAGVEFVRRVKEIDPDLPVLIQSSEDSIALKAEALGAQYVNKLSAHLMEELRRFMQSSLGFGDFVFLMPDGREVARVRDLAGMPEALRTVPEASLRYHASRNHFSNWCMARTEFALASTLRPVRVSHFESTEGLRAYLTDAFGRLRVESQRGVVADFSYLDLGGEEAVFGRIGSGSMGGKGRGLGFVNALLSGLDGGGLLEGVRVFIPSSAVVGTDVFDDFMKSNGLSGLALSDVSDAECAAAFLKGKIPPSILGDLRRFAERVNVPLAVRSSSLLEDSHEQPFAGIYRTCMLANSDPDPDVRLQQLCDAIRLVYASTFSRNAKAYLEHTPYRMEEEKMAVVLQRLVGRAHGRYFYPDFAGVVSSYNYYPVLDMSPEDGAALVALGLGKTVVEGRKAVRFSPGSPHTLPQFSSAADCLENAQRRFYALDLERGRRATGTALDEAIVELGLDVAEEHGTLGPVGSVYSPDDDAVFEGISRAGIRLVTFAPILKSVSSPYPSLLMRLLALGREAMSAPVEIEFAVDLRPAGGGPRIGFLQLRPLSIDVAAADLDRIIDRSGAEAVLCKAWRAFGQGNLRGVRDLVYVKPESFDRSLTVAVASELEMLNRRLTSQRRPYVLIGPGRWGTSDPWLGIPVEWHDVSGARVIVETDLGDVPVTPSEGTHFFHNMTALGVGYFQVHRREAQGFLDFEWLSRQVATSEGAFLRHLSLEKPLEIWIDGRSRRGLILKGASGA
ncbi:MAG: histidine kinase [Ignavibacteriaceae bacterium]|nr:histidine kinase [Ignavibacteriaceae bacterium]